MIRPVVRTRAPVVPSSFFFVETMHRLIECDYRPAVNLSSAKGDLDFFNGPAFLSWSRGQGMAGVGGADAFDPAAKGALPSWWFDQQVHRSPK